MIQIKLQELINDKGISQRGLAKVLDIRQDTINKMCNNEAILLRVEHLDKMCDYFDCSLEDLMEYKKDK